MCDFSKIAFCETRRPAAFLHEAGSPLVTLDVLGWDDCFWQGFQSCFYSLWIISEKGKYGCRTNIECNLQVFCNNLRLFFCIFKSPVTFASFELLSKCLLQQLVLGEEPGLVANCVGFALLGFYSGSMCFFMFNRKFFCMEVTWTLVKREAKCSHCVTFLNICWVLEPGSIML